MSQSTLVLAPAQERERLLNHLVFFHYPHFTIEAVQSLREMLQHHSPGKVARTIEVACILLCEEGGGPEWPDNGEMDAYLKLVEGLRALPVEHQALAAAA